MVMEIVVDGVAYAEVRSVAAPQQRNAGRGQAQEDGECAFRERMANWRKVVADQRAEASGVCAAWARWYVALRTSEAPSDQDAQAARCAPVRPLVAADVMDGWLVEAAYRQLGDFNDRMALKCRYIYGFDDTRIRAKLRGVRGSHVRLVIARAEKNLQGVLKKLDQRNNIRSTTCLPGCPVPTAATGASVMEA